MTARNEDLEALHKMNEELYISEKELDQLRKRNEFSNRLADAQWDQELIERQRGNTQELTRAEMDTQQAAAKEKIYEKMQLTQDEREKFDLMLAADKMLREAKTQNDVEAAMQEYAKSGLLREQELNNLRREVSTDAKLKELQAGQLINMTSLLNQQALDQQKAEWEMAMGNRRLQNDLDQMRMQDSYTDERRTADAQFEDSRKRSQIELNKEQRQSELDLDRQEQQNQMDMLKQAEAVRREREDAEHRRDMEAMAAARQFEMQSDKQKLDAELENRRISASMSLEQLAGEKMSSADAAAALTAKFNAQAAATNNEHAINAANQMTAFMQQQMQSKDKDTQDLRAMMMQMMQMGNQQNLTQMQMMRDVATANAGADQRANQKLMDAKQQELEHVRQDAAANSDRFVDGMKTTINAVAAMPHVVPVQPIQPAGGRSGRKDIASVQGYEQTPEPAYAPAPVEKICPHCNARQEDPNAAFCEGCGQKL